MAQRRAMYRILWIDCISTTESTVYPDLHWSLLNSESKPARAAIIVLRVRDSETHRSLCCLRVTFYWAQDTYTMGIGSHSRGAPKHATGKDSGGNVVIRSKAAVSRN